MLRAEIGHRPAVLIAESQADLRQVLRHVLQDAAYEPVFAADGIEAVSMVVRAAPDVLVLDVQLERLDGLLALELVRAIAGNLPVVLISSVASPVLGRAAERLGVFAVLQKPFRNADLLEAIARGLAQRNASQGAALPDPAGNASPRVPPGPAAVPAARRGSPAPLAGGVLPRSSLGGMP